MRENKQRMKYRRQLQDWRAEHAAYRVSCPITGNGNVFVVGALFAGATDGVGLCLARLLKVLPRLVARVADLCHRRWVEGGVGVGVEGVTSCREVH